MVTLDISSKKVDVDSESCDENSGNQPLSEIPKCGINSDQMDEFRPNGATDA